MKNRLIIDFKDLVTVKENNKFLYLYNVINKQEKSFCLDEIDSVIFQQKSSYLSVNMIINSSKKGIPVIFCNDKHKPVSSLKAIENKEMENYLCYQLSFPKKTKDRIWQDIVKRKIENQEKCLSISFGETEKVSVVRHLYHLRNTVTLGDKNNNEAQAARKYFITLFGTNFKRGRYNDIINSSLNYGYSVLRSRISQEIILAGLEPCLGIHHHSINNSFNLSDDLIEVFRPFVDRVVYEKIFSTEREYFDLSEKRELFNVLHQNCVVKGNETTVDIAICEMIKTLLQCYKRGSESGLIFPEFSK